MQVARNHHTVPQLFLKGFALNEKTLSSRWRDGTVRPIRVREATVIRDFYDPQLATALDDSIETWFSRKVENDGASVVAALRQGTLPTGSAIDVAANFVAFQMVRGASFRRVQMEIARTLGPVHFAQRVIGRLIEIRDGFDPTDAEVALMADDLRPRAPEQYTTVSPASMMRNMAREAQRLRTLLPTMHWSLVSSDAQRLVTSDTPVATRGPSGEFNDGPQVLPDGFEVLVPVSPTHLVIISPLVPLSAAGQLTSGFARDVNERQVRGADQVVLHHPNMAWPNDLVFAQYPNRAADPEHKHRAQQGRRGTDRDAVASHHGRGDQAGNDTSRRRSGATGTVNLGPDHLKTGQAVARHARRRLRSASAPQDLLRP